MYAENFTSIFGLTYKLQLFKPKSAFFLSEQVTKL